MNMHLSDNVDDLANELIGNWKKFQCFAWSTQAKPEDASQWCIVYTSSRDADALTRSNARAYHKALAPFLGWHADGEDAQSESHGHWAVGYVEGYSIRVRNAKGDITPAFRAYAELHISLQDYPIADDDDFSREEQEEADQVWSTCTDAQRIDYIRDHRAQFEFHSFSDLMRCVRGKYFAGYASELIT